jgi:hypothetical protein
MTVGVPNDQGAQGSLSRMSEGTARYEHARAQLLQLIGSDPESSSAIHAHVRQLLDALTQSPTGSSDALHQERSLLEARLRNFDLASSPPYQLFQAKGWHSMKFPEMVSVCEVLAKESHVPMDREAKRRKTVLFKWLSDNWMQLKPQIDTLQLMFQDD